MRKMRSDAGPEWLRVQRVRASRARWRAKQLAAGQCPHCGQEPAIHGGEGAACRQRGRETDARTYRRRLNYQRLTDEITPAHARALDILSRQVAWTPEQFAARMWPSTRRAQVGGRVLSLMANAGWVLCEQRRPRQRVYRLSDEGRRVLAVNRSFVEQARKQEAA